MMNDFIFLNANKEQNNKCIYTKGVIKDEYKFE